MNRSTLYVTLFSAWGGSLFILLFYLNIEGEPWIYNYPENWIAVTLLFTCSIITFMIGFISYPRKNQKDKHSFIITEKGLVLPKQNKVIALRNHSGELLRIKIEDNAFGIIYHDFLYRTNNGEVQPMFRNYIQDGCIKQFTCKCKSQYSAKKCRYNRQSKTFKYKR